jgi:PAS domain-containing protein
MILYFSSGVFCTVFLYEIFLPNFSSSCECDLSAESTWKYWILVACLIGLLIYNFYSSKKSMKAIINKARELEKRIAKLIKYIPEGVVIIDEAFNITHFNGISLKIFDSDSHELLTRNLRLMSYVEEKR